MSYVNISNKTKGFDFEFHSKNYFTESNQFTFSNKNLFKQIVNYFKKHLNNVKEFLSALIKNIFKTDVNREIIKIKHEINDIAINLKKFSYYKKEYYSFLKIRNIFFFILNNKQLYSNKSNLIFSKSLLENFADLMESKNLISSEEISSEEKDKLYHKNYNQFIEFLNNEEDYFYQNIYSATNKHSETIKAVSNILMR